MVLKASIHCIVWMSLGAFPDFRQTNMRAWDVDVVMGVLSSIKHDVIQKGAQGARGGISDFSGVVFVYEWGGVRFGCC